MPYLEEDIKCELERQCDVETSTIYLASLNEAFPGAINYFNFKVAKKRFAKGSKFRRYWQFALWTGTMVCCILEVYRRLVVEYEDEAKNKNGDV